MLANPVDKDREAEAAAPVRALFRKSVVARVPLAAGTVLREDLLAAKKPGTGIPATGFSRLPRGGCGATSARTSQSGSSDLEPVE